MDGWTYEDMTIAAQAAMHINWPRAGGGRRQRMLNPDQAADSAKQIQDRIRQLRELFDHARAYQKQRTVADAQQPFDLRLEGMLAVIDGTIPIVVRADKLGDIQASVAFAVEQNVRIIILGGYDAPLCADLLKKHNVPVIVSAVYRLPQRPSDPYDHAYTLPKRLLDAGIQFCISDTDRSESWNTRNLPFDAGTAVAFGLPEDEALKAVTLYPAQIMNVADRVGSLEAGKDATLIVTDGSPLDTRTQILGAYIQGRPVDLSNKQTRLYEKYSQKYLQLKNQSPK
jgi:imidazolonepropionase-like amidohydrolase